jgi:hypothetical protein
VFRHRLSFEQEHAVILNRWLGRNKPVLVAAGLGFVLLMGLVDILTGYDIAFSIFYLIPIALVTWLGGLRNGLFIGLVASMVWTFADYRDVNYRHPLIVYWNMLSSLGIFTVLAIALARLRASLDREKALARTDHLTGTANGRAFAEMLEVENNISLRYAHPFTLIYMDVDNFKTVNDTLGHHAGDTVLTAIAGTIRRGDPGYRCRRPPRRRRVRGSAPGNGLRGRRTDHRETAGQSRRHGFGCTLAHHLQYRRREFLALAGPLCRQPPPPRRCAHVRRQEQHQERPPAREHAIVSAPQDRRHIVGEICYNIRIIDRCVARGRSVFILTREVLFS